MPNAIMVNTMMVFPVIGGLRLVDMIKGLFIIAIVMGVLYLDETLIGLCYHVAGSGCHHIFVLYVIVPQLLVLSLILVFLFWLLFIFLITINFVV